MFCHLTLLYAHSAIIFITVQTEVESRRVHKRGARQMFKNLQRRASDAQHRDQIGEGPLLHAKRIFFADGPILTTKDAVFAWYQAYVRKNIARAKEGYAEETTLGYLLIQAGFQLNVRTQRSVLYEVSVFQLKIIEDLISLLRDGNSSAGFQDEAG